jgi:hypothetical protein
VSLRTRITLAAAVAVAAVSLGLGTIAYFAMRAQQVDEIRQQLRERVQRPHTQGTGSRDTGTTSTHHGGAQVCVSSVAQHAPAPALGGAPGYLQSVCPNGRVVADQGGTPLLPVTAKVRTLAKKASGSF